MSGKPSNRRHEIMTAREVQLRRNVLAADGGRAYVDARLWRAPNETDISWSGDTSAGIVGRRERTALVNDAGRISNKINQYIFKKSIVRDGIDEAFRQNCTGDGESLDRFMERVNTAITTCGWCWLQADRAALAEGGETLANRAPIRWILWHATDVPDWCLDATGQIKWLITRSSIYLNDDPATEAQSAQLFTLYHLKDGVVHVTETTDCLIKGLNLRHDVEIPGLNRIPFCLVGKPSAAAWWFDDVENIQAQILNLDSMHNETLMENVYPQLVLPSSVANDLQLKLTETGINGQKVVALIREATIGRKIPILESAEDKGISRFIAPSGDLKMLIEEGSRKRALLFDIAGLALFNKETRQIQTAESKQFDQLDTNSTLANRAQVLKDVEMRMVEMCRVFDAAFPQWEAQYPESFDVVDLAALSKSLVEMSNMPEKTEKVKKLMAKVALRILKETAQGYISDEEIEEAMQEIDETDFSEKPLPNPFDQLKNPPEDGDD